MRRDTFDSRRPESMRKVGGPSDGAQLSTPTPVPLTKLPTKSVVDDVFSTQERAPEACSPSQSTMISERQSEDSSAETCPRQSSLERSLQEKNAVEKDMMLRLKETEEETLKNEKDLALAVIEFDLSEKWMRDSQSRLKMLEARQQQLSQPAAVEATVLPDDVINEIVAGLSTPGQQKFSLASVRGVSASTQPSDQKLGKGQGVNVSEKGGRPMKTNGDRHHHENKSGKNSAFPISDQSRNDKSLESSTSAKNEKQLLNNQNLLTHDAPREQPVTHATTGQRRIDLPPGLNLIENGASSNEPVRKLSSEESDRPASVLMNGKVVNGEECTLSVANLF